MSKDGVEFFFFFHVSDSLILYSSDKGIFEDVSKGVTQFIKRLMSQLSSADQNPRRFTTITPCFLIISFEKSMTKTKYISPAGTYECPTECALNRCNVLC